MAGRVLKLPVLPPTPPPWRSRLAMWLTAAACVVLLANFYVTAYRPEFGFTKLIVFGAALEPHALPRLRTIKHYVAPDLGGQFGYDGQYYAQLALDPALHQPGLAEALDAPGYRARRIGLPAVAWALGFGKARWALQTYSVANALFWLLLLGATLRLLRPWSGRGAFCLAGVLLGTGTVASVSRSLTDVPATSLVFLALALPALPGGAAALAGAILTRETSLLALPATLDFRRLRDPRRWWRNALCTGIAVAPFTLWFLYVRARFPETAAGGEGNFALPFQEWALRLGRAVRELNPLPPFRHPERWWDVFCANFPFHELATPIALFVQGTYLAVRPDPHSAVWRVGALYAILGAFLGFPVWEETNAAARTLLPLTVAFYLRLAGERRSSVFWPFFLVGTLPALSAIRLLWLGED